MKTEKPSEVIEKRREKISLLKAHQIQLYPNDFKVSHSIEELKTIIEKNAEQVLLSSQTFRVAGRLMAVNRFGKSSFVRFKDHSGQMQAYMRQDVIGEEAYQLFKQLDVGDFLGMRGEIFQTKTGEWTLLTKEFKLLCKTARPLPEKFHGLTDQEKRYRQRYLDLIMNAGTRNIFFARSRIIQCIREFLLQKGFLEVETPMMQPVPGGAEASPFVTHHKALGMDLYLRIAPELYLKRLVIGGLERVFEINRNFRNEGISTQHNPEFTMLEFYQAYATYEDLMAFTEEMVSNLAAQVLGSTTLEYQGHTIELRPPWKRLSLADAMEEIGGIPRQFQNDRNKLLEIANDKGVLITKTRRLGKVLTKLFDSLVEPRLIQPTFITGYPVEVSPLSRQSEKDPNLTDRFELFVAGKEIANGFSELNDPEDQRNRFLQQVADREAGDEEAHCMDEDYIEALEYGLPPTAGEGIGIDRLVMLLVNASSIREVILFPHMKPSKPADDSDCGL